MFQTEGWKTVQNAMDGIGRNGTKELNLEGSGNKQTGVLKLCLSHWIDRQRDWICRSFCIEQSTEDKHNTEQR